ncbi:hypothetical protein BJ875DRAFT_290569 [Amylocarpus encephaloides]|uniref:Uncharacterized protein n=1 Tax=Amylocarpus encephaloides TaxID=45428 RepID=A0A9P7YJI2_9HELO|nr:hypothetical protein BJ875DRAFT_290569 [Amylocarpus encephaloides]
MFLLLLLLPLLLLLLFRTTPSAPFSTGPTPNPHPQDLATRPLQMRRRWRPRLAGSRGRSLSRGGPSRKTEGSFDGGEPAIVRGVEAGGETYGEAFGKRQPGRTPSYDLCHGTRKGTTLYSQGAEVEESFETFRETNYRLLALVLVDDFSCGGGAIWSDKASRRTHIPHCCILCKMRE